MPTVFPRRAQGLRLEHARPGARASVDEDSNLEAYVAEERTLRDHLTEQLTLAFADPARRLIGHHLIDMTDEAGYLRGDLDSARRAARRAAGARRGNACA